MADGKVKVIIYNSGRPLKTEINGVKVQTPDGVRELDAAFAQDLLKYYGHVVKLYKEVDKPEDVKVDAKEEVKEEVKEEDAAVKSKRGRPKKI